MVCGQKCMMTHTKLRNKQVLQLSIRSTKLYLMHHVHMTLIQSIQISCRLVQNCSQHNTMTDLTSLMQIVWLMTQVPNSLGGDNSNRHVMTLKNKHSRLTSIFWTDYERSAPRTGSDVVRQRFKPCRHNAISGSSAPQNMQGVHVACSWHVNAASICSRMLHLQKSSELNTVTGNPDDTAILDSLINQKQAMLCMTQACLG